MDHAKYHMVPIVKFVQCDDCFLAAKVMSDSETPWTAAFKASLPFTVLTVHGVAESDTTEHARMHRARLGLIKTTVIVQYTLFF